MKFKGSFSSVGVNWLERFVPIFDKLGKELSVLLTPSTIHLIQGHTVSGGLELHADLLQEEVFDEYKISSNNGDKIAFKLEPAVRLRRVAVALTPRCQVGYVGHAGGPWLVSETQGLLPRSLGVVQSVLGPAFQLPSCHRLNRVLTAK